MFRLREYIYLSIHSILVDTYIYLLIFSSTILLTLLIYLLFFPIYLFHLQKESSLPHQYSFYTCRYLYTITYIPTILSLLLPFPLNNHLIHSILVDTYIYLFIFNPLLIPPPFSSPPHSFYTCRYLYTILLIFLPSQQLTPHVLSEGCLEWCS